MWHQLFNKWFGLSDEPCEACEILRDQLHKSEVERRELLQRLLDKDKPEPLVKETDAPVPIQPSYTPWRVRQQMLEAEDRQKAKLMRDRVQEIEKLEKEVGIK